MSQWKWASPWGILRNGDKDTPDAAFHAGHLNDALRLDLPPNSPLLVASDTSGVWIVNETGGPAIPLSWNWDKDWGTPSLTCLAHGLFGPDDVYAAGASLWETDLTQPVPLLSWRKIPIVDANKKPFKFGTINRVVAIGQRGTLVLACDFGVFWAKIPPPGGEYIFNSVAGLPGQRFSSVAEGPFANVILGAWGSDKATHFGIFHGTWSSAGLTFTRSSIAGGIDKRMLRTEVVAFPGLRQFMYALCADSSLMSPLINKGAVQLDTFGNVAWQDPSDQDPILSVLKSIDGGLTWTPTGNTIIGKPDPLFPVTADHTNWAGVGQDGYNVCIGVSPFDRQIVAVGMNNFFLSVDGGDNWQMFRQEDGLPHLHPDIHALFFDQTDASRLYVCSDGGVALTRDLGATWETLGNRQLPNLECFRFAASPRDDGVLATSLQDNGNAYTSLYIDANPWTEGEGGDGRLSMIVSSGDLVRTNNDADQDGPGGTKIPVGQAAREAAWDPAGRAFNVVKIFPDAPLSGGVIPVDGTDRGLVTGVMEPVVVPAFTNGDGEPLVAVAADGESVLALFATGDGKLHWQHLGQVPHMPDLDAAGAEKPYSVTAVGSLDGHSVFAGATNGKVFRFDAPAWDVTNLSDPAISLQVTRLAVLSPDVLYLTAGPDVFRRDASGWRHLHGKLIGPGTAGLLPGDSNFTGIEIDRTVDPMTVYVASGAGVWKSDDPGDVWFDFNAGLPSVPQCMDLRIATETSGITFLYVSTSGWSVLRLPIGWNEILKPVQVNGHMDLVDRVAIGSDVWSHPSFSGTRNVGPLHPIEEMAFVENNGDEFRAELKVRFEWKVDFSIVLTVNAKIIDNSDDEVDDEATGTHIIPLGVTESVVVDLDSGEVWPDRAHMEFDVTNG